MSEQVKNFLLRCMSGGVPHYLAYVAADGLEAGFKREPAQALSFDQQQREEFSEKHGHIKGRWVLLANELTRTQITAKKGGTA